MAPSLDDQFTLLHLKELARHYPNTDIALAKIARLKASLNLPKGTIHVISDVHGEAKKLKHVVNNASGSLRLLVEETFGAQLSAQETLQLLNIIYYPRETFTLLAPRFASVQDRRTFLESTLLREVELLQVLSQRYTVDEVERVFPVEYRTLFRELLSHRDVLRRTSYLNTILDEFISHRKELDLLRLIARMIRNLLVSELIVAGDLGDRGERIDRVIEYLIRQPRVTITWGNHDASWMGACLGDLTCIATVVRISLRYGRIAQLEEGYGIPLTPLEELAERVYKGDPAKRFETKAPSRRDPLAQARMQKAIAIIQLKLEGQAIRRNPQFGLVDRQLLPLIASDRRSVQIAGEKYVLEDTLLPTVDPQDPMALSADEAQCMAHLAESFLQSPMLWRHMSFVARMGSTYVVRDQTLIFHACVPTDAHGNFLPLNIDGHELAGKALFDEIPRVIHRAFRERRQQDLDLLWYLWSGPRSPWFGKDKMTTFESYFIADGATHKEHNNPYFGLLHETAFCKKILHEFGVDPAVGLIVNGHIPVKIDQGESPMKRSGQALTIDGAFSEAYGDKGYTLILDPYRTALAQHHHFESVSDSILKGADIIPSVSDIVRFQTARTVGDTERGSDIRCRIIMLELLIEAFMENVIRERR